MTGILGCFSFGSGLGVSRANLVWESFQGASGPRYLEFRSLDNPYPEYEGEGGVAATEIQ